MNQKRKKAIYRVCKLLLKVKSVRQQQNKKTASNQFKAKFSSCNIYIYTYGIVLHEQSLYPYRILNGVLVYEHEQSQISNLNV